MWPSPASRRSNISFGRRDGGAGSRPDFDVSVYVQQNPDFPNDRSISPWRHYLRFGRDAGIPCTRIQMCDMSEFGRLLRESGLLDAEWYQKRYTDVRIAA